MIRQATRFLLITFTCLLAAGIQSTEANELFRDNLESGASWGMNSTSADVAATFGFNYGNPNAAIPEAPNTRPGDAATTGVKAEANIANPASAESFIIYPIGQNFTGEYQLRFDAWMNTDLDAFYNNGQAGTTEFIGGGIGYNNTDPDIGTGSQIIATGDGGSGSDWRAFGEGAFLGPDEMIANDRNGFNSYYADFLPAQTPPAGQTQIYAGTEGGVAGSPSFQWITFEINTAHGKSAIWIEKPNGDRLHISTVNALGTRPYTSDGNIGLYYADLFSSVAANPQLQFGLFDNVVVTEIPEPSSVLLLAASLGIALVRRRRA